MNKFALGILLCAMSLAAHAAPSIYIGAVYDYLDGGQPGYRKRVTNVGQSTAFVRVNLYEIIYGEGEPQEIPLRDSNDDGQPHSLIATPSRLIIPPKGTGATRLLFLGKRDTERYFRVRFVPVVPEKGDEFALPDEQRQAYKASFNAGINVLTGYGAVFIVRPTRTHFDTRIEQTTDGYSLTNQGNSTIVLAAFRACSTGDDPVCEPDQIHHVMPGKTYRVEKKPGQVVHFKRIEGDATYPTQI
jgi:hypothetical protein